MRRCPQCYISLLMSRRAAKHLPNVYIKGEHCQSLQSVKLLRVLRHLYSACFLTNHDPVLYRHKLSAMVQAAVVSGCCITDLTKGETHQFLGPTDSALFYYRARQCTPIRWCIDVTMFYHSHTVSLFVYTVKGRSLRISQFPYHWFDILNEFRSLQSFIYDIAQVDKCLSWKRQLHVDFCFNF